MNEAETRAEHIDPALATAGWGVSEGSRIRREYLIAPGRIEGPGRRGKSLGVHYQAPCRMTKYFHGLHLDAQTNYITSLSYFSGLHVTCTVNCFARSAISVASNISVFEPTCVAILFTSRKFAAMVALRAKLTF